MIPAAFDYVAPATVDEALTLLSQGGDDAKIIAGGQSLLPVLKLRLAAPELLIDLAKIDSLRGVRDDGDAIVIGAMTPHFEVVADPLVREHASLLAECVATVADPQVRHRGTLGGACAHADPASDIPAPVLALDAGAVDALVHGCGGLLEDAERSGLSPVLVCSPQIRAALARLMRQVLPRLPVISYAEVSRTAQIESLGVVSGAVAIR